MSEGTECAGSAENYEDAITALAKVVRMDAGYNDGEALFRLAEAYMGSGDNENAATYFQTGGGRIRRLRSTRTKLLTNLQTIKGSAGSGDTGDGSSGGQ